MKFCRAALIVFLILILCSCKDKDYTANKTEVRADITESYSLDSIPELYLSLANANIEIFTWNKDLIKFEVSKRLIGTSDREELSNELGKYNIKINNEDLKIKITESYKGNTDNIIEKYADIKIYTKNKMNVIKLKIKKGNVKFYDEMNSSLSTDFDKVDLEMNRFYGTVNVKSNLGNVSIKNSFLSGDTNIVLNNGNIYIKSEFDMRGIHKLKTKTGNIDLIIPDAKNLAVNCKGNVETNEFEDLSINPIVHAESKIGIIRVKKSSDF